MLSSVSSGGYAAALDEITQRLVAAPVEGLPSDVAQNDSWWHAWGAGDR